MDFDEGRLYYSHQQLVQPATTTTTTTSTALPPAVSPHPQTQDKLDLDAVQRHFREFLRNYHSNHQNNNIRVYREMLLRMHHRHNDSHHTTATLTVHLAHLGEYDASMLGYLLEQPAQVLPAMERGAQDALQTLIYQGNTEDNDPSHPHNPPDIQILLAGNLKMTPLRSIQSHHMNKLLQCPGIVISTSPVQVKALQLHLRCSNCAHEHTLLHNTEHASAGPFAPFLLPSTCHSPQTPEHQCGRFPYTVQPDHSTFRDLQKWKLQEAPERVPTGEMPRHVLLAVERHWVDQASPGTRVRIFCIPTLFSTNNHNNNNNTQAVYLRVVGMEREDQHTNNNNNNRNLFTPSEEQAFLQLAQRNDVYDILHRSIAPNIQGSYTVDIKKALLCQLMGGSPKKLPDGMRLRGDMNVLLLGDPSMAKSQFLKFISKVAPIGIYTSGKGSSAAGLTASVVRDSKGEFYLEGGAMVLADGGIVCIDEFDKMRPNDRVAIHEAMEQQTISVAKAGITTVLNSRSSVLAAANPVFGRYDDFKSASENIDLMTTILSRFDLIFLVRDIREEERDRMICQHVMGIHMNAGTANHQNHAQENDEDEIGTNEETSPEAIAERVMRIARTGQGELDVVALKKYVQYCKATCAPRLTEESGQVLTSSYVKIRDDVRRSAMDAAGSSSYTAQPTIPITVRQLEALVRIAESLAKLRLDTQVRAEDVTEALRLFRVSTLAASSSSSDPGSSNSQGLSLNRDELERAENFVLSRLNSSTSNLMNKQKLLEEAASQGFQVMVVARVLSILQSRGELLERQQGRWLKRIVK